MLILLSTVIVYTNVDKFENVFSQPALVTSQDDSFEQEEVLDPIAKNVTKMIQQLDESMIREYIEKITSFGPHPTTRRIVSRIWPWPLQIEKVRAYLIDEFECMGYDVEAQHWEQGITIANLTEPTWFPGWLEGKNIIAELPGTDKDSDEIYVMIAHYDTVPEAPGADDDSSGVAAILAAAKLMKEYSFNHTVHFLLVDGEEQWLKGSHFYVEEAIKNNDNIKAALCADMIGYKYPADKDYKLLLLENDQSSWVTDFIINVNQCYSEVINLTVIRSDHIPGWCSDHLSFWDKGLCAVFFSEFTESMHMHKSTDKIENMDVPYSTEVSKLMLATIAELAWDVEYE